MSKKIFFFTGKGGVGKTTTSLLFAKYLSIKNFKTLVTSLDPAHNLLDVFNIKQNSDTHIKISENLYIYEADPEKYKKKFLNKIKEEIGKKFRYLTSFNLEHYFELIEKSPILIEQALSIAFKEQITLNFDYFIFDMPPSALSYRFFSLPETSITWLTNLIKLRETIKTKKDTIKNIKKEPSDEDFILKKLKNLKNEYLELKDILSKSTIVIVKNPDKISTTEAYRVKTWIENLGLNVKIVENKGKDIKEIEDISKIINTNNLPLPIEINCFEDIINQGNNNGHNRR